MQTFDDIIRNKLSGTSARHTPRGWEDLSSKMDEMDMDKVFDEAIKAKLSDTQRSVRQRGWSQMCQWLDFSEEAIEKVRVSKAAEVGLMVLALICLFMGGYLPSAPKTTKPVAAETIPMATASKNVTPKSLAEKQLLTSTYSGGLITAQSDVDIRSPRMAQVAHPLGSRAELDEGLGAHMANDPIALSALRDHAVADDLATAVLTSDRTSSFHEKAPYNATQLSSVDESHAKQREANRRHQHSVIATLPKLDHAALSRRSSNHSRAVTDTADPAYVATPPPAPALSLGTLGPAVTASHLLPLLADKDHQNKWSLSGLMSLDYNQVRTPFDAFYERAGYTQNKIGGGGGVLVERTIKNGFGVGSGLLFSAKRYNPREFIELFKRNPDQELVDIYELQSIELNLVSIPLHLVHRWTLSDKWSVSARIGFSAQVALNAIYDKTFDTKRVDVREFVQRNPNATVTIGEERAKFEQKRFPDGLLGSGSLKDNVYVSTDIGAGIERQVGQHGGIFIQPNAFVNLFNQGLSANDDKLHIFSLQIGYRTHF